MKIRNGNVADIDNIRKLVQSLPPLDLHTSFSYWVLLAYFPHLFFVAVDDRAGEIIGFVSGIVSPDDARVCYLWQLGVRQDRRRSKCAALLTEYFLQAARRLHCRAIHFSIAPQNMLSLNTAKRFSDRHALAIRKVGDVHINDSLAQESTHEVLYEMVLEPAWKNGESK